ncbi:TonB-dependent receptor plug domain-containing protein [Nibribacter koreensis]|uniref:TonB-dependent receptor plug domain-containing protein n=2 Tax=Nibribacter koreensis TaxID=1084519 RepID=A0ABP8FKI6_9BACT
MPDSVLVNPIEITGAKYTRFAAGTKLEAVDTLLLQRQPGLTLADVLQQRSGLYLKSYGNGMTATVAFRGTTASHTAVLWNGFNIALPTLGLSDFALLPPAAHSLITLQHGPSGALHGSGAIGGAVLLENPADFSPNQMVRVQQQEGSFGHHRTAVSGNYGNGRLALTSSFTRTSADNNFKYRDLTQFGQPWQEQQNAAFNQNSFAQEVHLKLSPTQHLSVRGWWVKTHRQVQPPMGGANNNAQQDDENLRLMTEWQGQIARGTTTVKAAYFKDRLDYSENGHPSLSTVNTWQGQLEHERTLLPNLLLQVGTEGQLFKAEVSGYGDGQKENRYSAYAWMRYDPLEKLQISLNVRQAWVDGFNPPVTPTLGANFILSEKEAGTLTLKGNVSRSYRVPTLNDRYWRPGGNPDLSPESGWGYEAGLAHAFQQNQLTSQTEVTVYRLKVQDWIQWQPSVTGGYSEPVNLQTVRGHGLELDTKWKYASARHLILSGGAAYGYTISEQVLPNAHAELQDRQLFYVPKHKVAGYAEARVKGWWLALDGTFTSLRYTDQDNDNWLDPYALANVSAGKTIRWSAFEAQLMAQVQNLANTTYQAMAYRAMPPRHYRISLALQWAKRP